MSNNNKKPLLSLCIPTNGMVEWVIPAIDSIYKQSFDEEMYEIIITDNGEGTKLKDEIEKYLLKHKNLIYKKTKSYMFQNQIDCFKLANGDFAKFINHRSLLNDKSIEAYVNIAKNYSAEKPIVFFLNKNIENVLSDVVFDFDAFMYNLSYYSSWSGGISCWREDFDVIFNKNEYDKYFPHLDILLAFKDNRKYVINNDKLTTDQTYSATKKGKYDLFDAFAVHYMDIISELYDDNLISKKTYDKIKSDNLRFIIRLYFRYYIKREKCSYILKDFWKCFNKHYNIKDFLYESFILVFLILPKHFVKKIFVVNKK